MRSNRGRSPADGSGTQVGPRSGGFTQENPRRSCVRQAAVNHDRSEIDCRDTRMRRSSEIPSDAEGSPGPVLPKLKSAGHALR